MPDYCAYRTLIITGPNTGGKTVALKTVGLLTMLVQSGLPVPVGEGSIFSIYHHVCADIGDGQSIEQSLSTFSAHMKNMIEILAMADASTLVLIDEMASGTDPGEGVGLSIAILEELHRRGSTVVATTHYNEIKHYASAAAGFENARMEFDTETLRPLYRLRIGEAGRSYAFEIARNLGMPESIIARSQEITKEQPDNSKLHTVSETKEAVIRDMDETADAVAEQVDIDTGSDTIHEPHIKSSKKFEVGDSVYVSYLQRTGIVYREEDARGNVGVMIQKQKLMINQKRLAPHIPKAELYPDDYDMDIVFESKEDRKKRKLMNRKHVEGVMIVKKPE